MDQFTRNMYRGTKEMYAPLMHQLMSLSANRTIILQFAVIQSLAQGAVTLCSVDTFLLVSV